MLSLIATGALLVHGLTPISITGAITALLVSPALVWLMLRARNGLGFRTPLFVAFLLVETFFLVGYMTFLSFRPQNGPAEVDALDASLGAVHGIAALVVFVGFWALLPAAHRSFRRGGNLFRQRPALTFTAIGARALALFSGEAIFILHWVR